MIETNSPPRAILSGVETLVRLLVVRRQLDERDGLDTATMVSGYPGSPLGGLDLALEAQAGLLEQHRIRHQPGVNEELAAAVVWGSQMGEAVAYAGVDGVAGAWYGKTPGLDRSGDVLRHANAMGAGPNGGFVLFCGDDPTAKSSTFACDSQFTFADACIPVLYPGNQQEVIDLGLHAFRMSRLAGPLVGLKIVTAVADGIGSVDLAPERHASAFPADLVVKEQPWRHQPLGAIGPHQVPDQELLVVHERLAAAKAYARAAGLDRVVGAEPGGALGIVCAGKTYYDVVQALADLGMGPAELAASGIRILKLAMTWPLVNETILAFAHSVERLAVIEEKRPFIEAQLRAILHEAGCATPVSGKRDREGCGLVPQIGELNADDVAIVLARLLPDLASGVFEAPPAAPAPAIPARPPAFCSGCPHNRSTVAPKGALAGGGVGCHGIMYFEARQRGLHKLPPPPMGAEGAPWIGLAPFVDEPHLIQNLGDGTLSHSGSLAIRASVAAGVNTTFKILYNAAVAMTGGQEVAGLQEVPALTRALEAEGVKRIVVCSDDPDRYGGGARWAPGVEVRRRDDLPAVQEELRRVPGVTAIVYDQRCAAESRRLRKRGELETPPARVYINPAVCEGCGDCVTKSNCASVQPLATEFGEKKRIDQATCNRDYTCLEGDCPSFVTIVPKQGTAEPAGAQKTDPRAALPEGVLPEPEPASFEHQFGIVFSGIGGTGVVTANRILADAARAAGFAVAGMDQTGLSQRGGAVVSHLRLARDEQFLGATAIGRRGADLYLSGDILQAAQPAHLERIRPGRSVAVVDGEIVPTAAMQQAGLAAPAASQLKDAIQARLAGGRSAFVDARRIAVSVFGDPVLANLVLLGAACQSGGLPLGLDHVDAALDARGKAAARNRAAFDWGRWAVHDPSAVERALDAADAAPGDQGSPFEPSPAALSRAETLAAALPEAPRRHIARRTAQVIDYHDEKLARRYLDLVELAAAGDSALRGWALTLAVADGWFRLLAVKDEYEVARLHCATDYDAVARSIGIEGAYDLKYHIHPQQFRRLGMKRKLAMGRPLDMGFRALRRMKRLRGTPFDPFRWDADRKLEREVADEYEELIRTGIEQFDYELLVDLASSAAMVKGYGPVKQRNTADWRERVARLIDGAALP